MMLKQQSTLPGSQPLPSSFAVSFSLVLLFFEDEVRLTNMRSEPYQSLLDNVAKQLK
jgi:hypothetical protein